MAFRVEHALHRRRLGRNLGLGLVLVSFVALVFGLTIVKISTGTHLQAFDHVLRPEMLPDAGSGQPR
jgi:hypothetical protein